MYSVYALIVFVLLLSSCSSDSKRSRFPSSDAHCFSDLMALINPPNDDFENRLSLNLHSDPRLLSLLDNHLVNEIGDYYRIMDAVNNEIKPNFDFQHPVPPIVKITPPTDLEGVEKFKLALEKLNQFREVSKKIPTTDGDYWTFEFFKPDLEDSKDLFKALEQILMDLDTNVPLTPDKKSLIDEALALLRSKILMLERFEDQIISLRKKIHAIYDDTYREMGARTDIPTFMQENEDSLNGVGHWLFLFKGDPTDIVQFKDESNWKFGSRILYHPFKWAGDIDIHMAKNEERPSFEDIYVAPDAYHEDGLQGGYPEPEPVFTIGRLTRLTDNNDYKPLVLFNVEMGNLMHDLNKWSSYPHTHVIFEARDKVLATSYKKRYSVDPKNIQTDGKVWLFKLSGPDAFLNYPENNLRDRLMNEYRQWITPANN